MEDVVKEGRTVLFVSHNMAAITNLCHKAILLSNGMLSKEGTPSHVIEYYLTALSHTFSVSLIERTDRQGLGEIISRSIECLDKKENKIEYAISGQDLIIRLYYKSKENKIFKNSLVCLDIRKDESILMLLSTELVSTRQLDLCGDGYIDFIIPELPLSSSTYYLTSFIQTNGIVQDWVERAAKISVVDGDFYGTGRNYPQGWEGQVVLVKHDWRLETQKSTSCALKTFIDSSLWDFPDASSGLDHGVGYPRISCPRGKLLTH
jgi:lipopolysaccharide transport system ATP-binding protein